MSKFLKGALVASLMATPAAAETFGLGREALPEEVAAWDHDVRPDGLGMPIGKGDVYFGEEVYLDQCAVCHGDFGEGAGRWPVLAGGQGTLEDEDPNKTIGSFWPYLSTAVDYIYRAMPFGNAYSLSPDEVYGIVAYLMYMNDLVDDDFELSNENFAEYANMPNADGFFMDDRDETEVPEFTKASVCMENCKDEVEIVGSATNIDVTPETEEEAMAEPAMEETKVAEAAPAAEAAPVVEEVAAVDPELIAAGEAVYKKCKACHQVGDGAKNRTGPLLNGVVGAPVAHIEGFKYSKTMAAMGEEGKVWDDETLHAFLENPKGYVKKTKMSFAGLKKAEDRDAVIAYLATFK